MRIFTVHIKILCSLVAIVLCRLPLQAATPRDGYDADTLRGRTLNEVVVHRGKQRYSKRNNPAVDFARRIREARDVNDPRRKPLYSYSKYDRMEFGLHDFSVGDTTIGKKAGKFAFLKEYVDTTDASGIPRLPLSIKEKYSDVVYRRSPHSEKLIVRGIRQNGVDEIADLQNVQTMVEDVFREIDLYDDNVNLLQNRFVSPLSAIAPDFYKFYLTDTVSLGDMRCIVLSFAPRNPATFGFLGRIYVEKGDTSMFVRRVDMGVSPTINLNFIDHIRIIQEYDKAPDGTRQKKLDDFNAVISVIKGTQPLYARRTTRYSGHTFNPAAEMTSYLDRLGDTFDDEQAYERDSVYWIRVTDQKGDTPTGNKRIVQMMARLRQVPLYRYGERFLKLMVVGYVPTGNPSKFDFGPLNTTLSGNSVEGLRLRAGGITTANLSRHFFARGYVAYGTRDQRWKYRGEVEYSFNRKRYHSREFPIHSIRLEHQYDIDQLGQNYMFTNPDNMFLALKRGSNHLITYLRHTTATYQLELANNFSTTVTASSRRMEPGPWVPLMTTDGQTLSHYTQNRASITLRYAPGEKFYQTKSTRIPINLDPWVFVLTHTYGPDNRLGNRFGINRTEISIQKRFWFSAFGFADVIIKGAREWSRTAYTNLLSPNANLSYTIQPESFALTDPMEFLGDTGLQWDLTYWANGALFNYIPLLKKLKLREVIAFRGWWSRLSDKNNPMVELSDISSGKSIDNPLLLWPDYVLATPMHSRPYMEMSAGIDNLLKCLRVDYVWRLNYRDTPGVSRSGLRVSLHVTF